MFSLPGYRSLGVLHRGQWSTVARGVRVDDGGRVVVKFLHGDFPPLRRIAQLRHEFELARRAAGDGVVRAVELLTERNGLAIVFADDDGASLEARLADGPLEVGEALRVGLALAECLAEVHARGVVHMDVNPSNVVLTRDGRVRLIDFGIATTLARETVTASAPSSIEGTLAYMSPEQTGRFNRATDHRSDLYSLGATLYHMFTGRPPFESTDPMELMHAHLASAAAPLTSVRPEVPAAASEIVLKLLVKDPEARYASATGLAADLRVALGSWRATKTAPSFPLGRDDLSASFDVPDRLYGREAQVAELLATWERVVSDGSVALTFVTGRGGIGKSALVAELGKHVVARQGRFTAGKFDQLARSRPFSALVAAIDGLVRQRLAEGEQSVARWRADLKEALGANGRVLLDVIPSLELVVGPQPAVLELEPGPTQNRFRAVFQDFFGALGSQSQPLVMFIDDLQWADGATLDLLEVLLADDRPRGHLLLGAYRESEVGPDHPLSLMLRRMRAQQRAVASIELRPVTARSVAAMILGGAGGKADLAAVDELAALVFQRTEGNPFFVRETLRALRDRGLIALDAAGRWSWNVAAIAEAGVTDNVAELMSARLRGLPDDARRLLQLAACVGADFDLRLVARASDMTPAATLRALWPALDARLITPVSAGYRAVSAGDTALDEPVPLRFAHDRVQSAAYALASEDERAAVHARVGRLLLASSRDGASSAEDFTLADHLNRAVKVLDAEERRVLARLDRAAARRAMASAAHAPALAYATAAISLLGDSWRGENYAALLDLHVVAAECAMLLGDHEQMETHAAVVESKARAELDRVPVWETRIRAHMARSRMTDAVRVALEVLARLGEPLPSDANKGHVLVGLAQARVAIGRRSIEDIPRLPVMRDPTKLAVMRLLTAGAQPAYFAAPRLLPVMLLRMVALSARHGNSALAPYAWVAYGHMQNLVFKDIAAATAWGRMGMSLLEQNGIAFRAKVSFLFHAFIEPWSRSVRDTIEPLRKAYLAGLEVGDYEYGATAAHVQCWHLIFAGGDLETVEAEMRVFDGAITRMQQRRSARGAALRRQLVGNLLGRAPTPWALGGPDFDEAAGRAAMVEAGDRTGVAQLLMSRAMLEYIFHRPGARRVAEELEGHLEAVAGMVFLQVSTFFQGMIFARAGDAKRAGKALETLHRWSRSAPTNHAHRAALLSAELAALRGDTLAALNTYDEAVRLARSAGCVMEEAMALECAGRFHHRDGRAQMASAYLAEARHAWLRWRAHAKVAALDLEFPDVQRKAEPAARGSVRVTSSESASAVDVATVLKAAEAISGELVLSRLLERIMRLALENAGAVRGALLLPTDGELRVEAVASLDRPVEVLRSIALGDTDAVSAAVVGFVARTRQPVLLADARAEGLFTRDPWIVARRSRSILCAPLVAQGELAAVLFLENDLAAGAFPPERVEMLRLLSSQAAIAIDKARVHRRLEESLDQQVRLAAAQSRFVPVEFINSLSRSSILDIQLGENVRKVMSILFSDIRDFTPLVEGMTPQEHIGFINEYLSHMEPPIIQSGGFVDSYIGDAVMALFNGDPDDAVQAGVGMGARVRELNHKRKGAGLKPVRMGVGVNTGELTLGTIGGPMRIKCGVIGNPVNLAARVEGLTKNYGSFLLVTHHTVQRLRSPGAWTFREVGRVVVKGQSQPVTLFEVLEAEAPDVRDAKYSTAAVFSEGNARYYARDFVGAASAFAECTERFSLDVAAARMRDRARALATSGVPDDWDGVEHLTQK